MQDEFEGRIVKGIGGFYYVHVYEQGIYECRAKGGFRNEGLKPLVGDIVTVQCIDAKEMKGNVTAIGKRRSELIRPAVANVDQALIIFAIVKPDPNFVLLDRFLIMMQMRNLPCTICFNKQDIATKDEMEELRSAYCACGNSVFFVSALTGEGFLELKENLRGKTTALAGPSGVGKSSVINRLLGDERIKTGNISTRIERGKHTTRHSELFALIQEGYQQTYLMDTPGFSSLFVNGIDKESLSMYYPEFTDYTDNCRFLGCAHISEPVCGVKKAVEEGKIAKIRYENYKLMYREIMGQKKTYPPKRG